MKRFARCDDGGGSKLFSREVEAMDSGAFLARLWACFGPPDHCDGGFSYAIRDRETKLAFTAYSGASGPSYGGDPRQRAALRPVVAAFERALAAIAPVDCEHIFGADAEYGGGQIAIGWRDGRSFQESRDTRTKPESAQTYEQCVAIAREYEGGYGAWAGWQQCLDRVLPAPPDEVDWNGDHYEQHLGFTLDDREHPAMIYLSDDGLPTNVPVSAIGFAKMPAIATRWLDAYARWRAQRHGR